MKRSVVSLTATAAIIGLCQAGTAVASAAELEEAIALLKQMHADQCQQQILRGQVMLAHRNHDQAQINELWPRMETISARLKPSQDKLNLLKASIKKDADTQNAFETAELREAECG